MNLTTALRTRDNQIKNQCPSYDSVKCLEYQLDGLKNPIKWCLEDLPSSS